MKITGLQILAIRINKLSFSSRKLIRALNRRLPVVSVDKFRR